ncbi:MAG: hypothetical protein RR136_03215 [Clostridia bacterium]
MINELDELYKKMLDGEKLYYETLAQSYIIKIDPTKINCISNVISTNKLKEIMDILDKIKDKYVKPRDEIKYHHEYNYNGKCI